MCKFKLFHFDKTHHLKLSYFRFCCLSVWYFLFLFFNIFYSNVEYYYLITAMLNHSLRFVLNKMCIVHRISYTYTSMHYIVLVNTYIYMYIYVYVYTYKLHWIKLDFLSEFIQKVMFCYYKCISYFETKILITYIL